MPFSPLIQLAGLAGPGALSGASASGLPKDLLAVASRRLGLLALVTVAICVLNLSAVRWLTPTVEGWQGWRMVYALSGAAIALSLALFAFTRRAQLQVRRLIDLGLAYEVAMCALSAVLAYTVNDLYGPRTFAPRLSWVCPLLIFFPAIVPSTPGRTAVAALLGASMDPLNLMAEIAAGRVDAPLTVALSMHFPNYLCAGLGILVSHIITGLGREVRDARELGSYRLGDLLGRGGMGEVYKAEHRMLVRPAAIKLIRPETLQWAASGQADMAVERFRREAQAAASLRSPHTIALYDFGVTDDGTFYYVMELLDGIDLDSYVTRFGPMPAARAAHVLRQACDSLAEAHARDLVHRDVKPANILLCRQGLQHDFAKVLDFGLVKARRPEDLGGGALQTAADVVAGTPAFMAPEAAMGQPLDGRADVYGLGCVGYWLLTGHLVFDAPTAFQVLSRHIEDAPVPPSRRSEVPVPPELDTLILSCLAKDPARRPSAVELSRRLTAAAGDIWTDDHAHRWWEAHHPLAIHGDAAPVVKGATWTAGGQA